MLSSFIRSGRHHLATATQYCPQHQLRVRSDNTKTRQNAMKGTTIDRRLSCGPRPPPPLTAIEDDNDVPRRQINILTSCPYTSTSFLGTMPPDLSVPLKPRSQREHNCQDYESMLRRGISMLWCLCVYSPERNHRRATLMISDLIPQASFSATASQQQTQIINVTISYYFGNEVMF